MREPHPPTLRFLGATDTVTGSRYLVRSQGRQVLVDCGLFQGYKRLRDRNRVPFPVNPANIDAVVLTHAHLDHTGYLPALVRDGFRGRIYATPGTTELAGVMLPDSAHLLEEEARHAASHHWSSHADPLPLYTAEDAERALTHLHAVQFGTTVAVAPGVEVSFTHAGHILGASGVRSPARRSTSPATWGGPQIR
jgi:metallo-beta-lactamase family protein